LKYAAKIRATFGIVKEDNPSIEDRNITVPGDRQMSVPRIMTDLAHGNEEASKAQENRGHDRGGDKHAMRHNSAMLAGGCGREYNASSLFEPATEKRHYTRSVRASCPLFLPNAPLRYAGCITF
jgi:hypothetical protein